jgi:hypothetical protein
MTYLGSCIPRKGIRRGQEKILYTVVFILPHPLTEQLVGCAIVKFNTLNGNEQTIKKVDKAVSDTIKCRY